MPAPLCYLRWAGTLQTPRGSRRPAPKLCFRQALPAWGFDLVPSAKIPTPRDLRLLLLARGLRAFGDGYVSLLLPAYLLSLGYSAFAVGVIATATLLGSGALTLTVGLQAHRFRIRTLLMAAAGVMAATGASFAGLTDFWPLFIVAVVGTLNPSSGDASIFLPLEHAMLA